jgi:DNA-binding protein
MPTTEEQNSSNPTGDTPVQGQGEQHAPTGDTPGNGEQQPPKADEPKGPIQLPDDHPVIKQWKDDKAKLATVRTELTEAQAQAAKATKLEDELKARPTKEAMETLQTRYDRLEAFVQAAGGDISKALDSRTFTRDLFESDKDVAEIAKAWRKANPTATSTALSSAAAAPAGDKVDQNALLRAAAGK